MIAMRYTIVASVAGVSYAAYEDNHSQTLCLGGVAGMKLNLLRKQGTGNEKENEKEELQKEAPAKDETQLIYSDTDYIEDLLRKADANLRKETSEAQGGATATAPVDYDDLLAVPVDYDDLLAKADAELAAAQPLVPTGVPVLTTGVPVVEGEGVPTNTESVLGAVVEDGTVFGVRVEPTVQQPKKTEPEQTEVTSVGVDPFPASPAPVTGRSIYQRYMEERRAKTLDEINAEIDSRFTGENFDLLQKFRAAEA